VFEHSIIQGRSIGPAELAQVREVLAGHPDWSRYRLSCALCQVWGWHSLTGQIKDMAARTLLLKLDQREDGDEQGHFIAPTSQLRPFAVSWYF
jgi:hypothetical protein